MSAAARTSPAATPQWSFESGPAVLDDALGDAFDEGSPCSVWAARPSGPAEVDLDRRCRELGLPLMAVPVAVGGRLRSVAEAMLVVRTAARRDLSVMPATLVSVTAMAVALVAEDTDAVERIAAAIARGETVGFAMSEEASGSDVLASTARLEADPGGGWLLSGRKWLVGGGRRCRSAVVVAAHPERRGPGAFTAVLVELPPSAIAAPSATTGMVRCEFSDVDLDGLRVAEDAVVGRPGQGMELAMRAQQLVRVMSTAAPTAAMDTALRLAVRHLEQARTRSTPGRPSPDADEPRRLVGTAAVELVLGDVVTQVAAGLIDVAPAAAGLGSAVVKELAPVLARRQLARCADLLGARACLDSGAGGVLARLQADTEMVRHIDTSVAANQRIVGMHLATYDAARLGDRSAATRARDLLGAALGGGADPAGPDLSLLALGPRPDDPVVLGLEETCAAVAGLLRRTPGPDGAHLADLATWVWDELRDQLLTLSERRADPAVGRQARGASTEEVRSFCWIWAAACCVHLWWSGRDRSLFGSTTRSTAWLHDCLHYLRRELGAPDQTTASGGRERGRADYAGTRDVVLGLVGDARAVTATPHRLADSVVTAPVPVPRQEVLP